MRLELSNGTSMSLPIDFCEECGDAHEMEHLSRVGCRCQRCDPMGVYREGSMMDTLIEQRADGGARR